MVTCDRHRENCRNKALHDATVKPSALQYGEMKKAQDMNATKVEKSQKDGLLLQHKSIDLK